MSGDIRKDISCQHAEEIRLKRVEHMRRVQKETRQLPHVRAHMIAQCKKFSQERKVKEFNGELILSKHVTLEHIAKLVRYLYASTYKGKREIFLFIKPCSHNLYVPGTSLCEMFGLKKDTAPRIRKAVTTHYWSKTSFDEEEDKFKGKPFASYVHKLMKTTHYVMNPKYKDKKIGDILKDMGLQDVRDIKDVKRFKDYSKKPNSDSGKLIINYINNNNPLYPPLKVENKPILNKIKKEDKDDPPDISHLGGNETKKTTAGPKDRSMVEKTVSEMRSIWTEEVGTAYYSRKYETLILFQQVFDKSFDKSMEKWRIYCIYVSKLNEWYKNKKINVSVNFKGSISDYFISMWKNLTQKNKNKYCGKLAIEYHRKVQFNSDVVRDHPDYGKWDENLKQKMILFAEKIGFGMFKSWVWKCEALYLENKIYLSPVSVSRAFFESYFVGNWQINSYMEVCEIYFD